MALFRTMSLLALLALAVPAEAQQPGGDDNYDPFQFPVLIGRKSFKRAYWDLRQRAYPTETIPQDARQKGLLQIAQANAILSAPVQGNRWVSIGPAPMRDGQTAPLMPVSGRIADIVADPRDTNRWLIGGAMGGLRGY